MHHLKQMVDAEQTSEKTASEWKTAVEQLLASEAQLDEFKTLPLLDDNTVDEHDAPDQYDSDIPIAETDKSEANWSDYFGAYYERCLSPLLDAVNPWYTSSSSSPSEPIPTTEYSVAQQR
jgi:hypothetical protein